MKLRFKRKCKHKPDPRDRPSIVLARAHALRTGATIRWRCGKCREMVEGDFD